MATAPDAAQHQLQGSGLLLHALDHLGVGPGIDAQLLDLALHVQHVVEIVHPDIALLVLVGLDVLILEHRLVLLYDALHGVDVGIDVVGCVAAVVLDDADNPGLELILLGIAVAVGIVVVLQDHGELFVEPVQIGGLVVPHLGALFAEGGQGVLAQDQLQGLPGAAGKAAALLELKVQGLDRAAVDGQQAVIALQLAGAHLKVVEGHVGRNGFHMVQGLEILRIMVSSSFWALTVVSSSR